MAPFTARHQRYDAWFEQHAAAMLGEACRVLKPGGALVLGIIDRDSGLGQDYLADQAENVFYRDATFYYSGGELHELLRGNGFGKFAWLLPLSRPEIREIEPLRTGRGAGALVAVRALRPCAIPAVRGA